MYRSLRKEVWRFTSATLICSHLALLFGCGSSDRPTVRPVTNDDQATGHALNTDVPAQGRPGTKLQYWLALITKPETMSHKELMDEFEDDETLRLSRVPFGDIVIPHVNGSPVSAYSVGGKFVNITGWLTPGKNTIELRGTVTLPAYWKVFTSTAKTIRNGEVAHGSFTTFDAIVAKDIMKRGADLQTLTFDADVLGNIPSVCDILDASAESSKETRQDVLRYLDTLVDSLNEPDVDALVDIEMVSTQNTKVRKHFLREDLQQLSDDVLLARSREKWEAFTARPGFRCVTRVSDMRVVSGRYTVIAFAGETDELGVFEVFGVRCKTDEGDDFVYKIRLVRVDNRWVLF